VIVTIMQPAYLPWLGYFSRVAASDLFIVLDHVAVDLNRKTKFANRNRIRTAQGWTWLTVPIQTKGMPDDQPISDIRIEEDSWRRKHWRSIEMNYARAPFFKQHRDGLAAIYDRSWSHLCELDLATTRYLLYAFGISTRLRSSSEMSVKSRKSDLILDLCIAAGATEYISGPFGRDYLDAGKFDSAGIALTFHDYRHPQYRQCFEGFEPYMSAADLLLNCGPASSAILQDLPVRVRQGA